MNMMTRLSACATLVLLLSAAVLGEEARPAEMLFPDNLILYCSLKAGGIEGVALAKAQESEDAKFAAALAETLGAPALADLEKALGYTLADFRTAFGNRASAALVRICNPLAAEPSPAVAGALSLRDAAAAGKIVEALAPRLAALLRVELRQAAGVYSLPLGQARLNATLAAGHLLVTLEKADEVIRTLAGRGRFVPLALSDKFRSVMSQVQADDGGILAWYADADVLKGEAAMLAGGPFNPQAMQLQLVLRALGLDAVHAAAGSIRVEAGGFRTRSHLAVSPLNGLLALFTKAPLSPGVAGAVPADVGCVVAGRLDLPRLLDIVKQQVTMYFGGPPQAEAIEQALAAVSAAGGFDVRTEFIENFTGDLACFWLAADKAGGLLGLEGFTLLAGIKDRAAADKVASALLGRLAAAIERQQQIDRQDYHVRIKEFEYLGGRVRYVSLAGVLMPSVTVTDKFLVLSLGVYPPRRVLRCLAGRAQSLAQSKDFRKTMMRAGAKGDEAGFLYLPAGAAAGTSFMRAQASLAAAGVMAGLLLPGLSSARERARRVRCMSNLKQIGYGLQMYAEDYAEQFPQKLSELYPKYSTDVELFACPSGGAKISEVFDDAGDVDIEATRQRIDELCSYHCVSGLNAADPADMMLLYDGAGNHYGGGRNVLYIGYNVRWYPEMTFQRLLAEQRQRWERMAGRRIQPLDAGGAGAAAGQPAQETSPAQLVLSLLESLSLAAEPPAERFAGLALSSGWLFRVDDRGLHASGHFSGIPTAGGNTALGAVGAIGIISAIAMPNLLAARSAAVERNIEVLEAPAFELEAEPADQPVEFEW